MNTSFYIHYRSVLTPHAHTQLLLIFAYVVHSWRLFSCQGLYHQTDRINGPSFISLAHNFLRVATASH